MGTYRKHKDSVFGIKKTDKQAHKQTEDTTDTGRWH